MKFEKLTKKKRVVEEENLILNPLLQQTKSGKVTKTKKHYVKSKEEQPVLNEFIPARKNFGKKPVKAPQTQIQYQAYVNKNFKTKDSQACKLTANLPNENPSQQKKEKRIKNAKIVTKAVSLSVLLTGGLYLTINYGPALYTTFNNWLQAQFRPQSAEVPEFNINDVINNGTIKDDNISTNTGTIVDEDKTMAHIELSETCLNSYDLFKKTNLAYVLEMYLGDNREVTPLFVHPETRQDGSEALKIYCKLGESEIAVFEYDILEGLNEYTYNDLFNSSSISPSDVVNALSLLASDEYLADLPQTCPIINFDDVLYAYSTEAKEEVKGNIIDGEYVEENIYAFSIISLEKNGEILQKDIEISKEAAEALEGFDANDPYSLVKIYSQNSEAFNLEATYEVDYNIPTIILQNANKQLKKNQVETKTTSLSSNSQEQGL